MEEKTCPYLLSVSIESKYPENLNLERPIPVGQIWAVDYNVTLGDKNILNEYKSFGFLKKIYVKHTHPRYMNPKGEIGHIFFFTVYSPAYAKDPPSEHGSDEYLQNMLIQKKFDEPKALEHLRNKIDAIGNVTSEELIKALRQFLDTTDWDEEEKYYQ